MRVIIVVACLALTQAKLLKLTCSQIRQFVDAHNRWRIKILRGQIRGQPASSVMNHMVWDDELARKAGKWASKNVMRHNPDRTIASRRFTTGENLFSWSTSNLRSPPKNITIVTNVWADEHKNYKYKKLQVGDIGNGRRKIGHYTQIVWSTTTYLGCAISKFHKNKLNHFIYVCNYGPTGNFIGRFPYPKDNGRGKHKGKPKPKMLKCIGKTCNKPYGPRC